MTLRTRLVLWFCGTLSVILLIFCGVLLALQPQVDIATLDEELANDVVTVTGVLATETREIGPGGEAVAGMLDELRLPDRGIAVFDEAGTLLGAQWNGLDSGEAISLSRSPGTWTYRTPAGDARMHVETITAGGVAYRIAIASSLEDVVREGRMLRRAVIVAVPVALLLAAIGGAIAATRALRPVSRMAGEASAITATDPRRLTISNPHDEMGTLGRSFNGLIDRLNAALDQQRRFMADASHELRTPVSVVRTAAEVTLARDNRAENEYRESFRIVGEQARRLSGMVEDMFLLARVDAGQRTIVAGDFYFDEVVAECVRSSQLLADGKRVTIASEITADVPYSGDESLARQLVMNLLDNAVRHAPPEGRVWVSFAVNGSSLRLSVADNGNGVAADDRERIFERFVKLDPTRAADGGAGLGLSIARWVAEAHGGTLHLAESGAGRTTFLAQFPYAHPAG
jgi:two-component system, OmpR family, sensor kinase